MIVIAGEDYTDILFDLEDGRQICVFISQDGRYALLERPSPEATWGPPVAGVIFK